MNYKSACENPFNIKQKSGLNPNAIWNKARAISIPFGVIDMTLFFINSAGL